MITDINQLPADSESAFVCADCMDLMARYPDGYFDIAIVDPPYGGVTQGGYMNNKMGGGAASPRNDYHLSLWKCAAPGAEYFSELKRVSKNQIIWGGNYFASQLKDSQGWIVWDKEKPDGFSFADVELAYTSFNVASRIFHFAWNGMIQGDMKHKEYKIHPTQKPVQLYKWLIDRYTKPTDIILDTHVGSASSLIAAQALNRRFVGCELDSYYYQEALKRFQTESAQLTMFNLFGEI